MQYWKNKRTGRVVETKEPRELQEELAKATRRGKPLEEDEINLAVKRHKASLSKMDDSYKWERISAADAKKIAAEQEKIAAEAADAEKTKTAQAAADFAAAVQAAVAENAKAAAAAATPESKAK